jgi:putative DNA primase/helicase
VRKREPIALNAKFYKSHKRDLLLLPMFCPFDGVKSLYVIDAKGFKRPLKGTATNGLMMAISDKSLGEALIIWIVEGYATGLSLHRSVGESVVVAFTAGNLLNVVEKLVKKYPNARLKLCADNDVDTFVKRGFNPGVKAANKVKEAFPEVEILMPEFPEGASGLSDFNDLSCYLEDQQEVANDHR